jgi:hypothetical protein
MNERDLKNLYARWRAADGRGLAAPDVDAVARASLTPEGAAADAALLEFARAPEALAAYRVARELAPNSAGLARALGASGVRVAAVRRVRPTVWAAAAAVALMVLVVEGVGRRAGHVAHVARHDVINSGSFEGDAPPKPDRVFHSDFDG